MSRSTKAEAATRRTKGNNATTRATAVRPAHKRKTNRPVGSASPATPLPPVSMPSAPKLTKMTLILDLLRRPGGATLAEMMAATGWQSHSVRGALAGALRKRGIIVESSKGDGIRRYSVAPVGPV